MYNGIDVSKHNGDIDFNKVKTAGVDFVIIRAGYGKIESQKDPKFETYYKAAKAAGLKIGSYFYTYAKSTAEAVTEAKCFLKWIAGKTFDYPIYFDIEDNSISGLSKSTLTKICKTWCDAVEKAGYYVGIYANASWFSNKLDLKELENYDKWLAHWSNKPKWGDEFGGLWQKSSTGKISGINGNVDLDVSYRDYPAIIAKTGLNGLKASASTTTTPTTPAESTTSVNTNDYALNDIVNFFGGTHYASANATIGLTVKASMAKVTNKYPSGKHPLHLRAVDENGKFISGGVYGWCDLSAVSKIITGTGATFVKGDKVKCKPGVTKFANGQNMTPWVSSTPLYVRAVENCGKVLLVSTEQTKEVYTGRVNASDMQKI